MDSGVEDYAFSGSFTQLLMGQEFNPEGPLYL
jgi:hypothetical protein